MEEIMKMTLLTDKICTRKANRRTARFARCGDDLREDGRKIMKRIRPLNLVVASLFVVTAVMLLASAPVKVSAQTRSGLPFVPRFPIGFSSQASPSAFVQGLFQAPWRGFDTGIFGSGFGPASFATGDLD